ncbi:MAG: helix-hairpin-helix domain-containing protein [bacterium]|nr:helix-hairpin-helix domain-containing protein [bacterium]
MENSAKHHNSQNTPISARQLKFILTISVTAVLFGLVLLIQTYSRSSEIPPPLEVSIAEPEQLFRGLFIVDPNSSPADSLELLPGIGPVLADRIIAYRENQRFETEIDLINVNGIGPRLFERLRPYLKVHPQ